MPEWVEMCKKCGRRYNAKWHYGKIGTDEGYAEVLCCKEGEKQ